MPWLILWNKNNFDTWVVKIWAPNNFTQKLSSQQSWTKVTHLVSNYLLSSLLSNQSWLLYGFWGYHMGVKTAPDCNWNYTWGRVKMSRLCVICSGCFRRNASVCAGITNTLEYVSMLIHSLVIHHNTSMYVIFSLVPRPIPVLLFGLHWQ